MLGDDGLIRELMGVRREILALKTAQKIPALIRAYSISFNASGDGSGGVYSNGIYHYRVFYEDGDQPILSEFYYGGTVSSSVPSGNTQEVYLYSQYLTDCYVVSTRPMRAVTFVE